MKSDPAELSAAKRALLEKYLQGKGGPLKTAPTIVPRSSEGPVPLSFAQQQMWLLAQLIPDIPVYNETMTIRITGELNISVLAQSLSEIVRRHEAWRTSFHLQDGEPMQVVHPPFDVPLPMIDLRHLPGEEREAEALRLATEAASALFDLSAVPLLRVMLAYLGDGEYRLYLTLHHIISDGSIYEIFLPELIALYKAFSLGEPSPLAPLTIQYADFALWQRDPLREHLRAEQLAYWKQQLAGAPASLNLPTDHPTPLVPRYRGLKFPFTLSKDLSEALSALSGREGVTLYMTLVAAFQVLLYRYSGQDDLLIGTTTSVSRPREAQRLLGLFLNTLVLRADLSGHPSFLTLLKRVRNVILDAQAHHDVPFEDVVKALQPIRDPGGNPFMRVMFSLEAPLPALPTGWSVSQTEVEAHTSKFDLSLMCDNRAEGLVGCFEYNTDLFDESTIQRMVGHWQTLLTSIASDPNQSIKTLAMLTGAERHQLLVEWNAQREALVDDEYVHCLFEAQAASTPDAVALVYENTQLTYRELNERANQLAHYLQRRGVGPEVLVGLCVERSPEMIIGLLAILKAGGAFVPLDPAHPRERLDFILQDSRVMVLLTQQSIVARLPDYSGHLLCLDTNQETIAQEPMTNPVSTLTGENLAYVIYTSGSTGKPKGVLISQSAIATYARTIVDYYQIEASDRVLQFATLTFDISLKEIFPTLISGACLVLRGPEVWSPGELLTKVRDFDLTVVNLSAPYWHQVVQEWARTPERIQDMPLRLMAVGGDEMLPQSVSLWQQTPLRSLRLLNTYGPTEITVTAAIFDVPADFGQAQTVEHMPIGRPLPLRSMYVLDAAGQLVPVGVPGELYIGGDLLARGYLNRPELTADRFLPDPFSQQPGARMYKTGDLVRYRPDGAIEFLGRVDFQVKIRGYRIELGEIEVALRQQAAVQDAVVMARERSAGEKYLAAYIVAAAGYHPTITGLQQALQEQLPEYMVPTAFVFLDALPLSSNGKIDRLALPAPDAAARQTEETFVAPTSMVHYQLLHLWEDLLDVRPIGIRDNFFLLGGHSLLATKLVVKIEQVFGKKLPLSTLFAKPTIERLAEALQEEDAGQAPVQAVQAGGTKRPFFYFHGDWQGGAFYCFTLARDLGPDQPFYVLPPYAFDTSQAPPPLETMAAAHLKSLRTIQPEGPYLLGGVCGGALAAYEIALQLQEQGEKVDLLLLLDPGSAGTLTRWTRILIQGISKIIKLHPNTQFNWFLWIQHIYRYLRFPHYRKRYPSFMQPTEVFRQDWPVTHDWIMAGYVPRRYADKITFLWAAEESLARRAWWPKMYKNEEMHIIPGTHITCRTDHLHAFSECLRQCVNAVQRPHTD